METSTVERFVSVSDRIEPKKAMPKDGEYCDLCGHSAAAHLRYGVHECEYAGCNLCTSVGFSPMKEA